MITDSDGAWITRRTIERGLIPALITTSACVTADAYAQIGIPSSVQQTILTVTGRLTGEGAECRAMRGDDGALYTLIGEIQGWDTGARVRVSGERLDMSYCQQGITIRVNHIQQAD